MPRLWLDKVCIDQTHINLDLQCLPIFLAACRHLLVISGSTFSSRLWCCVELFVYVQMAEEDFLQNALSILTIGANYTEHARVRNSFRRFDAAKCKCVNQDDKTRILAIVASFPGGVAEFNRHVMDIALNAFGNGSRASQTLPGARGESKDQVRVIGAEEELDDQLSIRSL